MSFTRERAIKAVRKARPCDACGKRVEVGEAAIGWAGLTDGDFGTLTYHPDCREAEIGMNDLMDWRCGDDWFSLRDIDRDERPWLIETHPAVAARMGITDTSPNLSHGSLPMEDHNNGWAKATLSALTTKPTCLSGGS